MEGGNVWERKRNSISPVEEAVKKRVISVAIL